MELLTNTVPTVTFDYPDSTASVSTATYSLNGATPSNLAITNNHSDLNATAKLPYQQAEGQVQVAWTFSIPGSGTYTRTDFYEVVTPLLSIGQVKDIIGDTASDDEIASAEASARYIIQSYTGQTYGKYIGVLNVTGSGESFLRLPRRLITLTDINSNTIVLGWVNLRGGGWFIDSQLVGPPTIRADFDGWHQLPNSGVITPPPAWAAELVGFWQGTEYAINGIWGWDAVPNRVVEAAKLLVNDYACGDSVYRDRYITAITGPDWQLEFSKGAYSSTGNVRADQLLGDYKLRRGWMVI